MKRNMRVLLILAAVVISTGCPVYVRSELDGNWRASDGTVLEIRGPQIRVISSEALSYPTNTPPCTGYAYVWCKGSFSMDSKVVPKQLNVVYPTLANFIYCETDPETIGYSYTLTAGALTQQQAADLQGDYLDTMLDTLQLSATTSLGIYQVIDINHVLIALGDPGEGRPSTFDDAKTFTRDDRKYNSESLATFCAPS